MKNTETTSAQPTLSRRTFLKGAGALVVSFSLVGQVSKAMAGEPQNLMANMRSPLNPDAVDAWLAVTANGRVIVYSGKVELGTGVETALRQIVAEELDLPFAATELIQGDTELTPNQGYTAGSKTIQQGGAQLRKAAATAQNLLLQMAAKQLSVARNRLIAKDGKISVKGLSSKSVTYTELIGNKQFNHAVNDDVRVKNPKAYVVVGDSVERVDIPPKVTGDFVYVQDVRVPGMLHGRVVRPPTTGATTINAILESVDERSIDDVPGIVKVVRKGNFVGVIARSEWSAIQAARKLKVKWKTKAALPKMDDLYPALKKAASKNEVKIDRGDAASTLSKAAQKLSAVYRWPYQTHDSIGPSCAVADVGEHGATIWSGTQGVYPLRGALADLLKMSEGAIHVSYVEASGCYGHNGADDVSADAALLSQAVSRPVRVQWSRADEHGWDPKGPAMAMEMRGAVDANGDVAAWTDDVWTPAHTTRPGGRSGARNLLAGDLRDGLVPVGPDIGGDRNAPVSYDFKHYRLTMHWIPIAKSPLRPSALRSLGGIQNTFANESFMDELAAAAKADPVTFRLRHLNDPRALAVIRAAASKAGWKSRSSPKKRSNGDSGKVTGRGFSFVQYENKNAYLAAVAEVEVDFRNGNIRVKKVTVAHDCGLIINPNGLKNQIEGNVIQATSRTLKEEIKFNQTGITSLEWHAYPIITFPEIPEVDVVLIDRPHEPAVGAGEATSTVMPAAIANAVFDASGVRLRTVPFTPERVKAALAGKSV
jgi:CO/xanthine dehydrogenase Mo-binding subunit